MLRMPCLEVLEERLVEEVFRPERGVLNARLGERAVEVEHPHEPRPLARPIADGQDRPAVGDEPVEHVVRILPDGPKYCDRDGG